ncbi:P-II family nitrogen regulator [Fervidibacillus albus]|uniref:PII family protein n=1 Tax=Fervidibacillus albus TaxID=2980026 RepID=A0A9E8LW40_9BACI|nr:P-II family nitrogen regulator [Fervidibacillus albus]WAA10783.1 PII family protein [Fervidibacillus albus]
MRKTLTGQKLIVTIVKKEKAKKIIEATKKAGARGGTTLYGEGFRKGDKDHFFGIPIVREREIIFTIVNGNISEQVLDCIIQAGCLNKPQQGIAFVINVNDVIGMHLAEEGTKKVCDYDKEALEKMDDPTIQYDLIITIVNKGDSEKVVESSKKAGAEGGTIISGRGTGIHEKAKLFNILIEPEKEVVLTLIDKEKTREVLHAIEEGTELHKPGKGIAFVLNVEKAVGINHLFKKMVKEKCRDHQ